MQEREATRTLRQWTPYVTMLVERGTRGWQPEDREELVSEALFHAYRAIVAYDNREGVHVTTLIYHYVQKRIRYAHAKRRTQKHLQKCREILYSESIFKNGFGGFLEANTREYDSPLEAFPAADERLDERVTARLVVEAVPPRRSEARILDLALRGYSYAEIGRSLGISRQAIFLQIETYAKRVRAFVNKQHATQALDAVYVDR